MFGAWRDSEKQGDSRRAQGWDFHSNKSNYRPMFMPHVETPGRNPLIYTAMDILDFTFFINQPHHFISGG